MIILKVLLFVLVNVGAMTFGALASQFFASPRFVHWMKTNLSVNASIIALGSSLFKIMLSVSLIWFNAATIANSWNFFAIMRHEWVLILLGAAGIIFWIRAIRMLNTRKRTT